MERCYSASRGGDGKAAENKSQEKSPKFPTAAAEC